MKTFRYFGIGESVGQWKNIPGKPVLEVAFHGAFRVHKDSLLKSHRYVGGFVIFLIDGFVISKQQQKASGLGWKEGKPRFVGNLETSWVFRA